MQTALLIPCYNEENTIAKVISDFRIELPDAKVYVYDNNSTDLTAVTAIKAGANVRCEYQQGKGNVVRSMFAEIDADIYILVDGDDTYPAESVKTLISAVNSGVDMAVGDRLTNGKYFQENKRLFHNFGNKLTLVLINLMFKAKLKDIMSGYRVFNRKFVKNFPIISGGFELETLMTLHALDKGFSVAEFPVEYRDRPDGSVSKLNTFRDGIRVLTTIFVIFKDYKPFGFFGLCSLIFLILSLISGSFPVIEYIRTGLIFRLPLAILATGLAMLASLSFVCAMILNTISRYNRENYTLRLLDYGKEKDSSNEQNSLHI